VIRNGRVTRGELFLSASIIVVTLIPERYFFDGVSFRNFAHLLTLTDNTQSNQILLPLDLLALCFAGIFSNSASHYCAGNKGEAAVTKDFPSTGAVDTSMACNNSDTTACINSSASLGHRTSLSTVVVPSLTNAVIEIDCEELLSTMIEEASSVVGMVVERTNEAWAHSVLNNNGRVESKCSSSLSGGSDEDSPLDDKNDYAQGPIKARNATSNAGGSSNKAASVSRSPNLGAKKVSEVFFDPLKLEGADQTQDDGDDKKPTSGSAAHWEYQLEDSDGDDDCKVGFNRSSVDPMVHHDQHHVDFSDEENLNPFISAEKASHIVDFVFGELDDEIMVVPSRPTKKARIDDE
jgi:hypothetical protein